MGEGMTATNGSDQNYFIYDQYGANPMQPVGPIGIVPLQGSMDFARRVNEQLSIRRQEYLGCAPELVRVHPGFLRDDYRIPVDTVRFSSGEGKASFSQTVRGHDLFILVDVMNYSCRFRMFGQDVNMGPDDHYQDLKRVILAASGKARQISVIMPFLYESRQDLRSTRESLDCSEMLNELEALGVHNIITFDAHDSRVSNAVPLCGFEDMKPAYQMLKAMLNHVSDLGIFDHRLMIVSPDESGISRAMYYASMLGVPLGTFYRIMDYEQKTEGSPPVIAYEYLGESVEGKNIIIVDDMIVTGDSMLDVACELRKRKAGRIFIVSTYGLFTEGIERFSRAYEDGIFDRVFSTNLIYRRPELLASPWFVDVDMSKYVSLIIDALNHDASLSRLMDPTEKIRLLLEREQNLGTFFKPSADGSPSP